MALIDVECTLDTCAHVTENHYRRAADWQVLPPCEKCGAPTQRIFLPPRTTWTAAPVVVFRAPDGSFRYPGAADGIAVKSYEKLGYDRVELRGFADVRRFERTVNQQERARMAAHVEARHRGRLLQESTTRPELYRHMKTMSNAGRDVARAAVELGNARPQEQTSDPGFRVEVYSDDRSSRDASRGSDGRRRRD